MSSFLAGTRGQAYWCRRHSRLDALLSRLHMTKTQKSDMILEHTRRLQGSSLIALVVVSRGSVHVYLGVVTVLWSEHCRVLKS